MHVIRLLLERVERRTGRGIEVTELYAGNFLIHPWIHGQHFFPYGLSMGVTSVLWFERCHMNSQASTAQKLVILETWHKKKVAVLTNAYCV